MTEIYFLQKENDGKKHRCLGPFYTQKEAKDRWRRMQAYRQNYRLIAVGAWSVQAFDRIDEFAPWLDEMNGMRAEDV